MEASKIAAVIPAYNEEKHIGDVVRRTRQKLDDVLVVDDGSRDKTADRAREAGAKVIVHPQNRGKGETIKTGLRHWFERQIDFVIILDSDGQHRPEEIDLFVAAALSADQPKLILGNRMNDVSSMPRLRRIVNRWMSERIQRSLRSGNSGHAVWLSNVTSTIDSRIARRRGAFRLRNRNADRRQPERFPDRLGADQHGLFG